MTSGVYERSDTMRTHLGMLMQERWKSPEWRQKMVGLGLFADDIDLMSNAIKYLKKHGGGAEL